MARRLNKEQGLTLEERALELRRQGLSYGKIAKQLKVSSDTVYNRLLKRSDALEAKIADLRFSMKIEQSERAEYIQEEALAAWRDSREDSESERTIEKAKIISPTREEREPGPRGGELRRNRRYPFSDLDSEAEELARADLGGDDALAAFGDDGPPEGWYLRPDGSEATEEDRASLLADRLREIEAKKTAERLIVVERQTTKTTTQRDGNPAYLSAALAAGATIRAIWGLDAPREAAVELSGDDDAPLIFALPTIPIPDAPAGEEGAA